MKVENQNKYLKEGMKILLGDSLFEAIWRDDVSGELFLKVLRDIKNLNGSKSY